MKDVYSERREGARGEVEGIFIVSFEGQIVCLLWEARMSCGVRNIKIS